MIKIQPIENKKAWNTFLKQSYRGFFPFFQTWNWGEVQSRMGHRIWRIGVWENNTLVGIALLVEIRAKRGNYIHLRHGPVLTTFKKEYIFPLCTYIKKIAKERECSFIRMSPLLVKDERLQSLLLSLGLRNAPIHNMDSEICWVLDITPPEEQLLAKMRKSHRYIIKKALKEPIEILQVTELKKGILTFLEMYTRLASKRGFVPHRGLVEELEILGKDNEAVLFLAKYKGNIIGGALIDFSGPMAIYHHGAMDDEYKNLGVSYLLQWEAIREAKKRDKKIYNFWGIAPTESKKHPWYGLTLFKTGFGGEKKEFLHAQDLPLSLWYWKNYAIELAFKIRRGY